MLFIYSFTGFVIALCSPLIAIISCSLIFGYFVRRSIMLKVAWVWIGIFLFFSLPYYGEFILIYPYVVVYLLIVFILIILSLLHISKRKYYTSLDILLSLLMGVGMFLITTDYTQWDYGDVPLGIFMLSHAVLLKMYIMIKMPYMIPSGLMTIVVGSLGWFRIMTRTIGVYGAIKSSYIMVVSTEIVLWGILLFFGLLCRGTDPDCDTISKNNPFVKGGTT